MELNFINQLRKQVESRETDNRVLLGIGDDAAILNTQNSDTVLTVDLLTEGVDFLLDQVEPQLIGNEVAISLGGTEDEAVQLFRHLYDRNLTYGQ